jgi:hypothetical protein
MLERTTGRALPLLNRVADVAPAAQACCGACRTCVTTNIFTATAAALAAAVPLAKRLTSRTRRIA